MNIHCVIPSFKRTEKLRLCLESIIKAKKKLKKEDTLYIQVYFSRVEDLNDIKKYISEKSYLRYNILEKEFKASEFWNDYLNFHYVDALLYLTDDILMDEDCLENSVQELKKMNSDGVVGLYTTNGPENMVCKASHGLIGKNFIDRFPKKQAFCPDYNCLYLDEELYLYANKIGKFKACYEAKIQHMHPDFTHKKPDECHVHNRRYKQRDIEIHTLRVAKKLLWGESFEQVMKVEI